MGIVHDILVLIQCIAKICSMFDVSVLLSEPVYRVTTVIVCSIKIYSYFSKHGNKKTSPCEGRPEQKAGK